MRITIDTAHDSKEHIRKAIELLRSMTEGSSDSSSGYQDMFGNSSPSSSEPSSQPGGVFDMFSSAPSQESSSSYSQPAEKPPKPKGESFQGFELYE